MCTSKSDIPDGNDCNLAPLPGGSHVIRLTTPPKDYQETKRVLAIQLDRAFTLSSQDKQSVPPHLSVWEQTLTSPSQAYEFLLENREDSPNKLVICLSVDEVRQLTSSIIPADEPCTLLDVIWIYIFLTSETKKARRTGNGAIGHAGITGLDQDSAPTTLTNNEKKKLRKDLRFQLAELASKNNFLLDS